MSTPVCRSVHAGFLSRLASSRPRPRFCNGRASVRLYHRLTTATAGEWFCCWALCGHDISIESCRFCTATNKAYRWCIHIYNVGVLSRWYLNGSYSELSKLYHCQCHNLQPWFLLTCLRTLNVVWNEHRPAKDCSELWTKFHASFAYKDPCENDIRVYDEFIRAAKHDVNALDRVCIHLSSRICLQFIDF